ncbi:MAG: META domain-containing protein [Pseudomonadota bacterium]|nr:META domain-containing protein [Pseudomonadota bacterium]
MNPAYLFAAFAAAALALSACAERQSPEPARPAKTETTEPTRSSEQTTFVNTVWQVAESKHVAIGSLRVFLPDGTLVMTAPQSSPAFGAWRIDGGRLTITEDGLDYPTDILALSDYAFRIRMNSPGDPVEILFEPAKQLPMDSIVNDERADAATRTEFRQPAVSLWGTAWRLDSLGGIVVPDNSQATLEFPTTGRAIGNGSCNRFNGVVAVEGSTIQFGGLASTRKACAEDVMRQEDSYLAALRDAESFGAEGEALRIYVAGLPEPLRFSVTQATAERPAQSIERAAAAEPLAHTGIWTIVGHHLLGTSALNDDQARARYGETVRLTANAATSSGQRCGEPRYATRRVPTSSWLASEYQLPPGKLDALAASPQVTLHEVSCGGTLWAALGARLIEIDSEHALAPWDGAFFELARERDFRALGQEPGWQLEIRMGAEMRLTYDYGAGTAVTPAARVQIDPTSGTRTYHAVTEANDLRVVIVPVPCTDTMSGRPFAATVSVTLNGRTLRGCGEELATPYQG